MSQHPDESSDPTDARDSRTAGPDEGITDEKLPADLQPTDDNPLAQPLEGEDAKSPDELDMRGGKVPEHREERDTDGDGDSEG